MGRPKGTKNKNQSGISYPRKCNDCDHVSNNPQMWHYHKQIHDVIPENQLCDHGCGQVAMFRGTGGKYRCVKNSFTCPKYLEIHAKRVKEQWDNNAQRKEDLSIKNPMKDDSTKIKQAKLQVATKKQKQIDAGITDEIKQDFDRYSRLIRRRGARARKKWALSLGYETGKFTNHIDHKLSVYDAWKAGLPEEIVNHPMNLQIVEYKDNLSKGSKSSITVEELLDKIKASV